MRCGFSTFIQNDDIAWWNKNIFALYVLFLFMLNWLRKLREEKVLSLFSCLFIWLNDFVYTRWRIKNKDMKFKYSEKRFREREIFLFRCLCFVLFYFWYCEESIESRETADKFTSVHWTFRVCFCQGLRISKNETLKVLKGICGCVKSSGSCLSLVKYYQRIVSEEL